MGFTKEELQHYFANGLKHNTKDVETLWQRIQENPAVAGSCHLPLNASILLHLFKCGNNTLPKTQYGIFTELVSNCIVRHKMKKNQNCVLKSLDDLSEDIKHSFPDLCKLAYDGMKTSTVIFDLRSSFDTLGLLQGVQSLTPCGTSHLYNFLHFSIQELLAAIHIAQLKESMQVKLFKRLFYQSHYSGVFQFYAAKTKLQTPGIKEVVIDMVKKRTKDVTLLPVDSATISCDSQPLLLSLLHCLYEAQDNSLCEFIVKQLTDLSLDLSNNSLNPADCLAVGFFLTHCRQFKLNIQWSSIGDEGCNTLFIYMTFALLSKQLQLCMNVLVAFTTSCDMVQVQCNCI